MVYQQIKHSFHHHKNTTFLQLGLHVRAQDHGDTHARPGLKLVAILFAADARGISGAGWFCSAAEIFRPAAILSGAGRFSSADPFLVAIADLAGILSSAGAQRHCSAAPFRSEAVLLLYFLRLHYQ